MKLSAKEFKTLSLIGKRAVKLAKKFGATHYSAGNLAIDIAAVHLSGTPLDFDQLLAFKDGDFSHDVFGINKHIKPSTGELLDCFLPRCAKL